MPHSPINQAAYQGSPGAYSETAAYALLGTAARLFPCATLEQTFDALAGGTTAFAVVPVENTLAGSVTKSYDLLLQHDVVVVGEHVVRIDHVLIGRPGAGLTTVRRVLSHPVALAQCERFFRQHPEIEPVPVFDTAGAVPLAIDEASGEAAAIASRDAARLHGGAILAEGVQDYPDNFTRFLLLTMPPAAPLVTSGHTRTILGLRLGNAPGALWRALEPLAAADINLTKIEGRPVPDRPFEYSFVLEFGHEASDARVQEALATLGPRTTWMKVVGSF